ncbi:MAG: radical SAM protein, partial [Bacilli bacterium]
MLEWQQFHSADKERNFRHSPHSVVWELTRACQLQCLHCWAGAQTWRHPDELTTDQARNVIDQIAAMDHPLLVFTGGDPLERPDLYDLIQYAASSRLQVLLESSVTSKLTADAMERAKQAGLSRWAVSLDGATAETHDRFRGVSRSFVDTLRVLYFLDKLSIPIQINTMVTTFNQDELQAMADVVEIAGASLWSLFFLVPAGNAQAVNMVSPEDNERILRWLYQQSLVRPFAVRTTEAPFYLRIKEQRRPASVRATDRQGREFSQTNIHSGSGSPGEQPSLDAEGPGAPVNDGDGFIFISHTGEVYPSGFLPVKLGHVLQTPLANIYSDSSML